MPVRYRSTVDGLRLRRGPGTGFPEIRKLARGDLVQTVEAEGWIPVLDGDTVGWAASQYLEKVSEAAAPAYDFTTKQGTIQAIRAECLRQGIVLAAQIAYVLATVEWETAKTFRPVREAYWKDEAWRQANLRYYPYYGRGYVQLTWEANYRNYSRIVGLDLLSNPDLALQPDVALYILVHGFKNGTFTGKKISDYINSSQVDFYNARRCVNGVDRAQTIAGIARTYL